MLSLVLAFLVMLNPFALFLYLEPVRKDLSHKNFLRVVFKASLISFVICLVFFFTGDFLFSSVLQINFESFRIFGGIIIFSFAYQYILKGQKALVVMKEDLDDLASEIALPFMVGAGTISLSILFSQSFSYFIGGFALLLVFVINFFVVGLLTEIRRRIDGKTVRVAFDKNMEILLRLNGFFIGAIGINMILTGVQALFF